MQQSLGRFLRCIKHSVEPTAGCTLPTSQFAHTKSVVAAEVYLPARQSEHAAVLAVPLDFP